MDDKKRELKKRWKKAEKDAARSAFPLPDDKLEAMFDVVEMAIEESGCDHSLRATTEWLSANGVDVDAVVAWLENNGGFRRLRSRRKRARSLGGEPMTHWYS
jgi:hypothetical protein